MKSLTPFGLQLIQALLHQGLNTLRRRSPMVFCLEDLDAFAHPPSQTMREQLLRFLLAEIQKLSERDGKVLILALAQEQQALDHLLGSLQTPLFRDRISMEEVQGQPRQSSLEATAHCPSCQRPADPSWKHCAYCGDVLARACPNCGYLQPAGEDVRFCFECGYQFG